MTTRKKGKGKTGPAKLDPMKVGPEEALPRVGGALEARPTAEMAAVGEASRISREIEVAAILALRNPRHRYRAYVEIMNGCRRKRFAESGFYSFKRGGRAIVGPSAALARMIAANWRNVRYGADVVGDDGEAVKVRGWAYDVEANVYVSSESQFKKQIQRKVGTGEARHTEWIVPDERDLRELVNKHAAICERNCILKLIPPDIVEEALDACLETARKDVSINRATILKRLVNAYADLGITPEALEETHGHPLDQFTDDEIVRLRGVYRSITEGHTSPAKALESLREEAPAGTGKGGAVEIDLESFAVVAPDGDQAATSEPEEAEADRRGGEEAGGPEEGSTEEATLKVLEELDQLAEHPEALTEDRLVELCDLIEYDREEDAERVIDAFGSGYPDRAMENLVRAIGRGGGDE